MRDVHEVTCARLFRAYIPFYRVLGVYKVTIARLFRAYIPFYRVLGVYKVTIARLFRTHCEITCTVPYM